VPQLVLVQVQQERQGEQVEVEEAPRLVPARVLVLQLVLVLQEPGQGQGHLLLQRYFHLQVRGSMDPTRAMKHRCPETRSEPSAGPLEEGCPSSAS
jgi:hypothetical protein